MDHHLAVHTMIKATTRSTVDTTANEHVSIGIDAAPNVAAAGISVHDKERGSATTTSTVDMTANEHVSIGIDAAPNVAAAGISVHDKERGNAAVDDTTPTSLTSPPYSSSYRSSGIGPHEIAELAMAVLFSSDDQQKTGNIVCLAGLTTVVSAIGGFFAREVPGFFAVRHLGLVTYYKWLPLFVLLGLLLVAAGRWASRCSAGRDRAGKAMIVFSILVVTVTWSFTGIIF